MKNLFKRMVWIVAILALTIFGVISCNNPVTPSNNNGNGNSGGDNDTGLKGAWQNSSDTTKFIVFSGDSFTKFDNGNTGYKGSYNFSDDLITFSRTQKTTNAGISWLTDSSSETGTFVISGNKLTVSITGGSSTEYQKKSTLNPLATALTAGTWKDDIITTTPNGEAWYSVNVTSGSLYYVWWNESGSNGNGTKTLDVSVSAYYKNGISIFEDIDTAWSSAMVFRAIFDGVIYLKVTPKTQNNTGSFGIVYNTSASRPSVPFNPESIALTENIWDNGSIASGSDALVWYSLNVTSGQTYYIWWNERRQYIDYGDGTKTLDINVTAFTKTGSSVFGFSNIDSAWNTAKSYTATYDGVIYLRVTPKTTDHIGSYGIVYSSTNSRPAAIFTAPENAIELNDKEWHDGNITNDPGSIGEEWYSISIESGKTYRIWWNETGSSNGNGTKTLDVEASSWYSNGASIFINTDTAWSTAQSFTAASNGTIYIRVNSRTPGNYGTFGIVYSTIQYRPLILPDIITPLANGVWKDGEITDTASEFWYSFDITGGTTYYMWSNLAGGRGSGDGSKTLTPTVSAWYSDGTPITIKSIMWSSPESFTPASNDTVYIRVQQTGWPLRTGTYGIMCRDNNTRTLILPAVIKPLENGVWKHDVLIGPPDGRVIWYSFNVTSGRTYRFWSNTGSNNDGNGLNTTIPDISAYYSNGVEIFKNFVTSGAAFNTPYWNNPQNLTPSSNDTIYVRVAIDNSSTAGGPGTFDIVYTENNSTRPVVPFNPPTQTPLTSGVWMDGEITESSNWETWFTFPVIADTYYYVWCNDSYAGDHTKTLEAEFIILYSDGTFATTYTYPNSGNWSSPFVFTPTSSGPILVRVNPRRLPNTGTFGIVYNTVDSRPQ